MTELECPTCGEVDPSKFYESTKKRMGDGHRLRPYCAECQREKARVNYRKKQDPVENLLAKQVWESYEIPAGRSENIVRAILLAAVHIREGIDQQGEE